MRAQDFLRESEGGIIRRSQEVAQGKTITFADANGVEINLDSTVVVPEGPEVRYETIEEFGSALDEKLKELGSPKVLYYSKLQKNHGAALITLWKDTAGTTVAFIKFANAKKGGAFPITWTNADFGRETGFKQINNKIAERAQFNLKPNALFPTGRDLDVASIINAIDLDSRSDLDDVVKGQISQLLDNVLNGSSNPVAGAAAYATTYEVDLGESAAPIALATGHFVSGSYREAEESLLAPLGKSWADLTSVNFPGGGSNLLYDSYMKINEGTYLKVSSKDKKGGAAAAVTGLMKDIQENPDRFTEVTSNKQFQEILQVMDVIASNTAMMGPLRLAEQLGMLDHKEAETITNLLGKGQKYTPDAKWAKTKGIQAALQRKGAKFEDPAYDMGYHLLAGVAEQVADYLNGMSGIDNFFRAILERSTMVQVKAGIKKSGDGAAFNNFTVIYPPVFTGHIKVLAGNNYMATRKPIGKISFKIG